MKKLRVWLVVNDMTQGQFAKQLGITPTTLSLIVQGKRQPGTGLIKKIVEATGWEIEPNDFFPR